MALSVALALSPGVGSASEGSNGVVHGFGLHMPLTIVVRQIVPRHIPVSFDPGVDTSLTVNWRGGDSWQEVLAGTLGQVDLTARITPDGVRVGSQTPLATENRPLPLLPGEASGSASVNAPSNAPSTGPELVGWRLVMARPGYAWAIGPGDEKLGPVEIKPGDSHPILGHIEAIVHEGDRWIVQAQRGWFAVGPNP